MNDAPNELAEQAEQPSFEIEKSVKTEVAHKEAEDIVKAQAEDDKEAEKATDPDIEKDVTENHPKKKSRGQKRIESLSREKRDLQKRIEELEGKKVEAKDDELNADDFESYDDYLDAVEKQDEKPEAKSDKKDIQAQDDFQNVLDEIEIKFDEARDKYEDFDDLVQKEPNNGGPHITAPMVEAMNEADNSGEIAYELSKDVKESIRISKLSPLKQIIAIDKLGVKLAKQTTTEIISKVKKVTSAPEPINAIGGSVSVEKTLNQTKNFSDYSKLREQENASKAGW